MTFGKWLRWRLATIFRPLPQPQAWWYHNHGRFRVVYEDGKSMWMDKQTAKEYASMFHGTVERQENLF